MHVDVSSYNNQILKLFFSFFIHLNGVDVLLNILSSLIMYMSVRINTANALQNNMNCSCISKIYIYNCSILNIDTGNELSHCEQQCLRKGILILDRNFAEFHRGVSSLIPSETLRPFTLPKRAAFQRMIRCSTITINILLSNRPPQILLLHGISG